VTTLIESDGLVDQEETSKIMEESALMSTVNQTQTTGIPSSTIATMEPTKVGNLTNKERSLLVNHSTTKSSSESEPRCLVEELLPSLNISEDINIDSESEGTSQLTISNLSSSTEDQRQSDPGPRRTMPSLTREDNY